MPAEEFAAYHLETDEAEEGAEAVVEKPEAVGNVGEQEEERAEAHDGEDVGGVDDDGVLCDGEDGGDGVDGEDDVAELYHQQHEEEGCHLAGVEEVVAVALLRDGEVL